MTRALWIYVSILLVMLSDVCHAKPESLYIGRIGPSSLDGTMTAAFERAHSAIVEGARAGLGESNRRYKDVFTYEQIRTQRADLLNSVNRLEAYAGASVRGALEVSRRMAKANTFTDYLSVAVYPEEQGTLRIEAELYSLGDWQLKALKSIGGCGESADAVLSALRQTVVQIVAGQENSPIDLNATASPPSPVRPGDSIQLDSCGSLDAEHDAYRYRWLPNSPAAKTVLPERGVERRVITLRPGEPGAYSFKLIATPLLRAEGQQEVTREVHVAVAVHPVADAGPDCIVRVGELVTLGACGGASACVGPNAQWRMVTGPSTLSNPSDGRFAARVTGRYRFELEVKNEVFTDTDEVEYLVVPKPSVRIVPVESRVLPVGRRAGVALPGESLVLRAVVPFDPSAPKPMIYWVPQGPPSVELLAGEGPVAVVQAPSAGRYKIAAYVRQERTVGGRELWDVYSREYTIEVQRPGMTLALRPELAKQGSLLSATGRYVAVPADLAGSIDLVNVSQNAALGLHGGVRLSPVFLEEDIEPQSRPSAIGGVSYHWGGNVNWPDAHLHVAYVGSGPDKRGAHGLEAGGDLVAAIGVGWGVVLGVRWTGLWLDEALAGVGDHLFMTSAGIGIAYRWALTLPWMSEHSGEGDSAAVQQ